METYDNHAMRDILVQATRAIRNHRYWFVRLSTVYDLHPVIYDAVDLVRPRDWQQLLLEYPHKAETDPNRIAYTKDERAGEADRQTVTTIGKYLGRHFDLPDHTVRDLVAKYTCNDKMYFVHTVEEMVDAVCSGPNSCMKFQDSDFILCLDGVSRHPYAAYDPEYGWHMALRANSNGEIDGRALCVTSGGDSYFVRSFKRGPGYSYSDEHLEAWLKSLGYKHRSAYDEGQPLRLYRTRHDGVLAPYVDGDLYRANAVSGGQLKLREHGELELRETGGIAGRHDYCTCDDCGEDYNEDEGYTVGAYEDRAVGPCCIDHYVMAVSRRGNHVHIYEDNVVWIESQDMYYHIDYLDQNNIVELENGDCEHVDNAVCIDGDWYHVDDENIVRDYNDEFRLEKDCWRCYANNEWYLHDEIEPVIVDGETYHPNYTPVTTEETEGDTNA
jgi:hypothetical protein